MLEMDTTFMAGDGLTPEFAARLSNHASRFESSLSVECGNKLLSLDSLICILAMEMYRGVPVRVIADGSDERAAAEDICKLLRGEK